MSSAAVYEPSKRIFLGGLPDDTTKKDIIDFIKKRSRANPMHIEIAKTADGKCKGFAHATVEGLRNVIESVNGIPMKGAPITVAQANPHFSVGVVKARRDREREEERQQQEAIDAEEARMAQAREMPFLSFLPQTPPPHFYAGKRKHANAASELAAQLREQHRQYNPHHMDELRQQRQQRDQAERPQRGERYQKRGRDDAEGSGRRPPRGEKEAPAAPAAPVVPAVVPIAQPTKEERKLAALQAKLMALQSKILKK